MNHYIDFVTSRLWSQVERHSAVRIWTTLFLSGITELLSKMTIQFISLATEYENSHCFTASTIFGIVKHSLILANLFGMKWYFIVILRILSLSYRSVAFKYILKINPLLIIIVTNICGLSFHFVYGVFCYREVFNFNRIKLISFRYGLYFLTNPCPL